MDRCKAVQMAPPGPSVLARGLQNLTARHIDASPDASFRTSMLRTTLRLDARPSPEQVAAYQKHLQAELEVMQTAKSMSVATGGQPKLRAVDTTLPPKAKDATGKAPKSAELCKYFAKASGCKRGDRCAYSHSLQSFDRETRSRKCLRCGAEGHRQRECPVGKAAAKTGTPAGKDGTFNKTAGGSSPTSTQSTMATLGTTSGGSTLSEPVQGTAWTLETLVQAAQQMVQNPSATTTGESSPEKTRPEVKVINLCDIRVCSMRATALLDSGATHSLRNAISDEEWAQAEDVAVQLAGRHQLMMKITATGTLLMPPKKEGVDDDTPQAPQAQTIVPMGQLIKTLGYSMMWTPDSCELVSPEGERMFLQVDSGCPQLHEMEALALIARLEDRKVEQLRNATILTEDHVGMAAMAMEKHWNHYLYDYVVTGSFESGLRAVRDAPFFQDLPGDCLAQMIPSAGLRSGWDIMKQIGWLTRAQRRRLWSSKRWIVHLFAGVEGHWEIMRLDKGDAMVIELDSARCAGHDLLRSETWRMLLWGAVMGKVDVIMGGPPDRVHQHCRGGERDVKGLQLVARMMWLFTVAQVGREVHGLERDVGFLLEYPEGTTQQERDRRRREVEQMEEAQQSGERTNETASWYQSRAYWETVQRPRWEDYAGVNTVDGRVSFWDTRLWKFFQREAQTQQISFDQGAMGANAINRTTLGTNIHSLLALRELRVPDGEEMPERSDQDFIWSPGLVNAIVVAVGIWYQEGRCVPRVCAMTPEKWKQHVDTNHAEYRKDCATCVMARGVGRQHRKVHHPESYTLTSDVAGPLNPGLDATSKGTMGKNLRYLLVAKYLVPKRFIESLEGKQPPDDHGVRSNSKEQGPQEDPVISPPDGDLQTIEDFFKEQDNSAGYEPGPVMVKVLNMDGGDAFVEEELSYEPSEAEEEAEEEVEEDRSGEEEHLPDVVMYQGDCEPPDMTYLTFATALPNNRSGTVRQAVQDVVLYLQMHGMPVYRFHSDKGEFYNNAFRSWLREMGIYGTWSEPSVPQSNGHAESTVRWVKDRTRTLLQAASLPVKLWPVAAAMAAAEQRAKVLNWKTKLVAPFGAKVHLRKKAFDKYGPLRREQGLESKWLVGRYVGLSTIVHNGHVVYVPRDGEEREKFLHTLHVRPDLVDPGAPTTEFRVEDAPKPRRKIVTKTNPQGVEMRAVGKVGGDIKELAITRAGELLTSWSTKEAVKLVNDLAELGFFQSKKFGVYRHGGAVGWLNGLVEYKEVAQVLVRLMLDAMPEAAFTSVMVSHNSQKGMHKDFNNDYKTSNYVLPLCMPDEGGHLWVELSSGDTVVGDIEMRSTGTQEVYGQWREIEYMNVIQFPPNRYHEVMPWKGTRTVLIAYTPDCLGKLTSDDLTGLHENGFPIPISQLPEYHGDGGMPTETAAIPQAINPEDLSNSPWLMYLDLDPGTVELPTGRIDDVVPPVMFKTEVSYTHNIEDVLKDLKGPLDVTHTVSPDEVLANLEAWRPAILKEIKGIEVAVTRLPPGSQIRSDWLNKPGLQRLPMKFVFTVKPNDKAVQEEPGSWYKRKARLVICGNMAINSGAQVYTETAPAEAVRAGMAVASRKRWCIAILDVVAAFIKTPLGRRSTDPVVVAQPPKLLEVLGLTARMELWGLIRALYGLREAPTLWGSFRDDTLRTLRAPAGCFWDQGKSATAWWSIRNDRGQVKAIVIVYVDDFMICGPREVVEELSEAIQEVWETSELSILGPHNSIRFLGMELKREEETSDVIHVYQMGYIAELLRTHNIQPTQQDRVPITKELAVLPEVPEASDPERVREAQQITGEVLWVSQRTRPDLAFATSVMAALCSRAPSQAVAIGNKVLRFLQRTAEVGLIVQWKEQGLVMFCDAAFAPQGARSHSGWVVTYGSVPISWRSGRQTMVALSTAEAELMAMLDGAVATKSVEALLQDIGEQVHSRRISSDSTSALNITTGSSSWRTRHLRIKANWLMEQICNGLFTVEHCPGERQPADLLTKALSAARIDALLTWWGVGRYVQRPRVAQAIPHVSSRAVIALICCILMVSARAAEDSPRDQGVQVDWDTVSVLVVLLAILGTLCIWELIRWGVIVFVNEYTPGASSRRLRRLRKLQTATTRAIEQELTRLQRQEEDEAMTPPGRQDPGPSARSQTPDVPRDRRIMASSSSSGREGDNDTLRLRSRGVQRTPSPRAQPSTMMYSPSRSSPPIRSDDDTEDKERVVYDVCYLLQADFLTEALRTEGLPVSGLKEDKTRRISTRLSSLMTERSGPTVKQLKYVLWLWRVKKMSGRHSLRYHEINDRGRVSSLIAQWKER